jgi:hypothetical protein
MVINKLETSLTGNTRVIIYDCHMFIVQATGGCMVPDMFCNFYLAKHQKIAKNSRTNETRENISTDSFTYFIGQSSQIVIVY